MQSRRGPRRLGFPRGKPDKLIMPSHGTPFDVATTDKIAMRAPTRPESRRPPVRSGSDAPFYVSGERP